MTVRKILPLILSGGALLLLAACAPKMTAPPVRTEIPVAPRTADAPPDMRNLPPAGLRARFGAPAFTRKDGATEMWRYDGKTCHAFFFLTGGIVSHVETIPKGARGPADPACLNALKKSS